MKTNKTDTIVESYAYDMFGNRIATTDVLGNMVFKSYDPVGCVVAEWGATYPVRFSYDTQGRNGGTYYTYASDGFLASISTAEAVVEYAYTHDRLDAGYTLTLTNGTLHVFH